MNDDEDLKPCPCCGSGAYFDMVESDGLIDGRAGGWFVECNNSECRLTTQLMFATGDDPRPRLREIWNKRHNSKHSGGTQWSPMLRELERLPDIENIDITPAVPTQQRR